MTRLTIEPLSPDGAIRRVLRHPISDVRGSFTRLFCDEELAGAGWIGHIRQANLSMTARAGTIRGMHFQRPPHAETKLVLCLRGRVWDVAVDVRQGSPHFLNSWSSELSATNGVALLIPPGFAHGFQTLSDDVELLYLHSAIYVPAAEDGLNPLDPRLSIAWPLDVTEMSDRDLKRPALSVGYEGIAL